MHIFLTVHKKEHWKEKYFINPSGKSLIKMSGIENKSKHFRLN